MKIGIILTGYGSVEYVEKCLSPWIEFRRINPDTKICAVSVLFDKFEPLPDDGTQAAFVKLKSQNDIDNIILGPSPTSEVEARTSAAQWLIKNGSDTLWQVDLDEFYTVEQIERIIKFINRDSFITCYQLSLKNYIFTERQFLRKAFTPMRIHRVVSGDFLFGGFYDDNNGFYLLQDKRVKDISLASKLIPETVAWIKHITWLSDERSRRKINYQTARGWNCSFTWRNNKLEFNEKYYLDSGQLIPEVVFES